MVQRILDKLFLLGCSTLLYYFSIPQRPFFILIPLVLVLLLTSLETVFVNIYLNLAIYLIYLGICCFFPFFTIFIPVILYELEYTVFKWMTLFCFLPFVLFWNRFSPIFILFTILFLVLSLVLSYKTSTIELLQNDYEAFRKTAKELALVQEEKNKSILENQDYQIQTATLNERNRISKEIHDHVGHLLSRSLIQIGALLTISKEAPIKEGLSELKSSISEGMDTIRTSIHNMHDESIDLDQSINGLIRAFSFCPITYHFALHFSPPLKLKYCFLAIIKESLSNIVKHGKNVSEVVIDLSEHADTYQLHITDNGTISEKTTLMVLKCQSRMEYPDGLGLQSISDRVRGFNGKFFIQTATGFELTIQIPKETEPNELITH
ncbi:MAG: sensor histidine kinase [Velocimicrobium sp.]